MNNKPDFLFEVSWEVCNKVGGIHTVISTKAYSIVKEYKNQYILIGPDLWRDVEGNPEFEEDTKLFQFWREKIEEKGLKVRAGRWKILGNPIVLLIDFSSLYAKKDNIFAKFWEIYGLDSLYGGWDYIEPAMFGYAAGMVIESFVLHHLSPQDKIVAQFHEWMTGTGILYLKQYFPYVATSFTTHATVVGRALAGNRFPLYKNLPYINADQQARQYNVISKHSLEKISAREADVFTTVSEITAEECQYILGKRPEVITPNGFEKHIVPPKVVVDKKRKEIRGLLKKLAESLIGYSLPEKTNFVAISGRYEFWNKGIDVFIQAMAQVNARQGKDNPLIAFILVPADNYGPRKELLERLSADNHTAFPQLENKFLTHHLHHEDFDLILKSIKEQGFTNGQDQAIKIIYIPSYLNGNDGLLNIPYYDVLLAMDQTVFPSYYEPWGYTPLESLAFYVPTMTTSLAGFGRWLKSQHLDNNECIKVIERNDDNTGEVIKRIADEVIYCSGLNNEDRENYRNSAHILSLTALWQNLVKHYFDAYSIAIEKANSRIKGKRFPTLTVKKPIVRFKVNHPHWRTMLVETELPEKLKGLEELAKNLWWSWNPEAQNLFEYINPRQWHQHRNPIKILREISYERLQELEKDAYFLEKYQACYKEFKVYLAQKPEKDMPLIAYFSMEFGLARPLRIYSGGLGILAGDYLKQVSDSNVRMIAVGLMYKYGYFNQKLSTNGEQISELIPHNFSELPINLITDDNGQPVLIKIGFPGRELFAQIWKVEVGRIPLFLLDTDLDINHPQDRSITHQLYGGDLENRLKQEFLLGIGGVRALTKLGYNPDIYHMNEGHTAFLGLEVIRNYMEKYKFTFAEALELTRVSTLFTTHTPVAAGHDHFPDDLMMSYFGHYPERLKISWEEFMALGKIDVNNKEEQFSMSILGANLAQEINAVSRKHRDVTREMFSKLWPGYFPQELHIDYVTNGIHFQTWANNIWKKLLDKHFSVPSKDLLHNKEVWYKIYTVPEEEIWRAREAMRAELVNYIRERITQYCRHHKDPHQIIAIENNLNKDALILGFARRFATYKRAHLLFMDIERLDKLINNPQRPVQILIAGKAHPADKAGQDLIKRIIEISNMPEFIGKIIFLEDYDMDLARRLISGVDVWINTPTRPLEASGTSGMKASANGVLNLSVLDGWWIEGYVEGAGWALPEEKTYDNQEFQDRLDAEMLYEILETQVIPAFYERDENGIPKIWIEFIKKNIAEIAHRFTTARMLDEYFEKFYNKMYQRKKLLYADDFINTRRLSAWKHKIASYWDDIDVVEIDLPKEKIRLGQSFKASVSLDLGVIDAESIGVELVISEGGRFLASHPFTLKEYKSGIARYDLEHRIVKAGVLNIGIRLYPKNNLLPHRQDFAFVKWI